MSVGGAPDERIAQIADAQRGRVNRHQLRSAGITTSMIHTRVAGGRLYRLHQGVYVVGHRTPVELGRETAAALTCHPNCFLSHSSAAGIWGLRAQDAALPVELTVLRDARPPGILIHRTSQLTAADVRTYKRLPITSPARTLLDMATTLGERELERALDEALIMRLVRPAQIQEVLTRMPRRAGAPKLKALLDDRRHTTVTRSQAEEYFLELIRNAGLPQPETNVRLHRFTVDFLWRAERVVVEIDGYQFHYSRSAFERDRRKDLVLDQAGLHVLRFTWSQMREKPLPVIATVARSLAMARAA